MGNINQTVCGSVKPHLTMTAKERMNTSTNLIIEPATLATPDPECCEHCGNADVLRSKLCYICFEDQYSDGARW